MVYLYEHVHKIYFSAVFLKMRQTISTLSVILSFMKYFVGQTSILEKLNISTIYKTIIIIFRSEAPLQLTLSVFLSVCLYTVSSSIHDKSLYNS